MHGQPTPAFEELMQSPIEQLASGMFPKTVFVSVVTLSGETGFEDLLMMSGCNGICFVFICSLHSRSCTQTDRSWF